MEADDANKAALEDTQGAKAEEAEKEGVEVVAEEEEEEEEEQVGLGLVEEASEEGAKAKSKERAPKKSKEERKRDARLYGRGRGRGGPTEPGQRPDTGDIVPTDPALMKSFRSAVVVVPPIEAWPPIQAIRRMHDHGYVRWLPHVNMLYPFVPNQRFPQAAETLREALASFPAFRVKLREYSFFKHRRSWTVWLKPETQPEGALIRLQSVLESAFPHCNDLSQISENGFTPHLSVANDFRKGTEMETLMTEWQKEWKEMEFDVTEIYMISRLGANDTPFDIRYAIPLLSSSEGKTSSTSAVTLPPPSFPCHPLEGDERAVIASPTRVIAFNLPFDMTEDAVIELFQGVAQRLNIHVEDVKLIRKPKLSGRAKRSSTGRAFIELRSPEDQAVLLAQASEITVDDRTVTLRAAQA